MEEVLAESARPHRVGEVLARGRDDRDIRWLAPGAAEPPHRAVLEHLQELRLDALRQQAHLVQKKGAAVGGLKEAGLGLARVGERPALEAEQLRLEQGLRDGRAVHLHEGAGPSWARLVNGARQEAFARSRLALDEDRREATTLRPMGEEPTHRLTDGQDAGALAQQLGQPGHGLFYAGVAGPRSGWRSHRPTSVRRARSQGRAARGRLGPRTAARIAVKARASASRASERSKSCRAQGSSTWSWRMGHLRFDRSRRGLDIPRFRATRVPGPIAWKHHHLGAHGLGRPGRLATGEGGNPPVANAWLSPKCP